MNELSKSHWQTIAYYVLGTMFTSWFVVTSPLTISPSHMFLSVIVAGSKWAIQIIAAFILLRNQWPLFVKNIGFVYFVGSCLLLPYVVLSYAGVSNDLNFYNLSLLISVMVMVFLYYRAVELTQLSPFWWLAWVICQVIAILLQVTWVFRAI